MSPPRTRARPARRRDETARAETPPRPSIRKALQYNCCPPESSGGQQHVYPRGIDRPEYRQTPRKTRTHGFIAEFPRGFCSPSRGVKIVPGPSHFPPTYSRKTVRWSKPSGIKPPIWEGQPRSWMSNLGRAGGTRTHDPRIMSTLISVPEYTNPCRMVPDRPPAWVARVRQSPHKFRSYR